jgi:hypothetical protein
MSGGEPLLITAKPNCAIMRKIMALSRRTVAGGSRKLTRTRIRPAAPGFGTDAQWFAVASLGRSREPLV